MSWNDRVAGDRVKGYLAAVPAAVLVVGLMFGTASAYGSVLRISHRTAVAACGYARQHGSRVACSTAPAPAARVRAASSYQNPVSGSAADPSGLNNNGSGTDYYLYTTGNGFPIKHSSDLVTWTNVGNALAHRPSWVVPSGDWHPWAPSVLQVNWSCPNTTSPTCYYMYYVGLSAKFNAHCVALATSTTPAGPFSDRGPLGNGRTDASGRPVGCGDNAGYGNIDPAPFLDTNQNAYLYVSTDNACPAGSASCSSANSTFKPTISVMRLGAKRLAVVGPRYSLFSGDRPWEHASWGVIVEGPWMEAHNGYHLFYSGGDWTRDYGMGDATLKTPLGPVVSQDPNNPILHGTANVFSPGGGSTLIGPQGGDWMLYHARLGSYNNPRQLFIDRVVWHSDGTAAINGPTTTPQSPAP